MTKAKNKNKNKLNNKLSKKIQASNLSLKKVAKTFIQSKYNDRFANQVPTQLENGTDPTKIKISSKLP